MNDTYYFALINKNNKTIQLFKNATCLAKCYDYLVKKYNITYSDLCIKNAPLKFEGSFQLKNKIELEDKRFVSKKYQKFNLLNIGIDLKNNLEFNILNDINANNTFNEVW